MKIIFLPILIALSLPAFAGLASPSDEKAVLAAEKQYIDGMVKSDPDSVAKVLADDLSYTHSSAKMETKADVLKGITNTVQYTSITVESTKVRQYGNTIITNHHMMYTGPKVSSHVYVTMVWVKQGGGWQMVQRQATKLPQQ
jgi:ketosteroid isomerase-like protein